MSLSFPLLSAQPARPESESSADMELLDRLRKELANQLHMGVVQPGDRLPSIRAVARSTGMDHRSVARAYHALEEEGLVEVRGRSGVFVADPGTALERAELGEWASWLAQTVAEAWQRRLSSARLASLIATFADGSGLRCGCVESNDDQMTAYCAELGGCRGWRWSPCASLRATASAYWMSGSGSVCARSSPGWIWRSPRSTTRSRCGRCWTARAPR
jgi:DNA-binding transcriptional regulator YhcF (GntR family)